MAQPLECGFFVRGDLTATNDLLEVIGKFSSNYGITFGMGTGSGNVNNGFADQRTLATNTSESLDLSGTALDNIFGVDLALTKLKGLFIWSLSTNTTDLTIGNVTNGITTPFGAATNSVIVKPGGFFGWADPLLGADVTAGTADLLKIANAAGASATYNIVALGL
jgi:hypothetical protein